MARKKARMSIAIDPALVKRLDRLAKATQRSRSAVVEEMCREGLAEDEGVVKAFSNPVLRDAFFQAFGSKDVLRQLMVVMGEKVKDDQLDLFGEAMRRMVEGASGPSS